jgi:hypothetical protein
MYSFKVEQMVEWSQDDPYQFDLMDFFAREYGDGPFKVLAIEPRTEEMVRNNPHSHPQLVVLETADGTRHTFSGAWLQPHQQRS